MDGKELKFLLRKMLTEEEDSPFFDDKTAYDAINWAYVEFVEKTESITSNQEITTVADTTEYLLNADFIKPYLKDDNGQLFLKYYDGASYNMVKWKDFKDVIHANNTTSVSVPQGWCIKDYDEDIARVTGTATGACVAVNGECHLDDSAATFITSKVSPWDIVHNTTDDSSGVVLSVNSETQITTAQFNGTDNIWQNSDAYIIQPQGRLKLVIDPASATAGHTITLYYVRKPEPLYASYRTLKIQSRFVKPLISYAAYLFKNRENDYQGASQFFKFFDRSVTLSSNRFNDTLNRQHRFQTSYKNR